ncbi:hypothetical protein GSY69_01055 [Brevibacterium sp. 5221]|uniref:Maltokinase N-terminal cap domain-containing protein n=1 Tax=Brevibacterium rongguiense TaxID=2695267 RepID=A0A6N9H3V6_9MICO|nr:MULTISPECIES: hypothetical protein [Brevibacterium]MYM18603.1 hypothetical protein [Brevibacterium rongguiense]WAL41372.1 hypothetical protein BRM1_05890 [Brevibacterium sp. BRM-1]
MAIIYEADLSPTKLEAISRWLPQQAWAGLSDQPQLELVSSYRFDDPAGEVGAEVHLVRAADCPERLIQVPLTYRPAPVPDLEAALVSQMDHSILGRRWIYDGTADPVFAAELLRSIVESDTSADEWVQKDSGEERRDDVAEARGTGAPGVHLGTGPAGAAGGSGPRALPAVQETDGAALIAFDGHRIALFRFPEAAGGDALSAESHALRVRLPEGQGAPAGELLAARLLD